MFDLPRTQTAHGASGHTVDMATLQILRPKLLHRQPQLNPTLPNPQVASCLRDHLAPPTVPFPRVQPQHKAKKRSSMSSFTPLRLVLSQNDRQEEQPFSSWETPFILPCAPPRHTTQTFPNPLFSSSAKEAMFWSALLLGPVALHALITLLSYLP